MLHTMRNSFAVESESIRMGNVRIVQKVKYTRSTADADKCARDAFMSRYGPYRPIRSRIPGPISDIGPGGTKICCDLEIGV